LQNKLLKLFSGRSLIALVLLLCVGLLAGGVGFLNICMNGAQSYDEYIFTMTAPFAGGFVLIGFFGFLYAYRNRFCGQCLYGFLVVGVSYICLEILFNACVGA
jgi:hypothetical protein